MSKALVFFCFAYVAVGVASFSVVAWFQRDPVRVVKVKQVPTFIPKPTEVKR